MAEAQPLFRVTWDDGAAIARCQWSPGSICGRTEAEAVTDALRTMGRGSVPLLVDMREMDKLERPAREHFMSDKGSVSAIALVAVSPVARMMANFFISMKRMNVPIQMFTADAPAVDWLQAQS